MRNLDECQAEVFRRSEKRIMQRKRRRNHVLMACIPFVLCITLCSAFVLPAMLPAGSKDPGATEAVVGGLTEDRYESLTCPIVKITVNGSDFSQTCTNTSDILLFFGHLHSYSAGGPDTNGAVDDGAADEGEDCKENAYDASGITADSANTGYTITLVMHEGEKTEYYLAGNTLKNLITNQTHTLSPKQVNELKDLLGIPHQ